MSVCHLCDACCRIIKDNDFYIVSTGKGNMSIRQTTEYELCPDCHKKVMAALTTDRRD